MVSRVDVVVRDDSDDEDDVGALDGEDEVVGEDALVGREVPVVCDMLVPSVVVLLPDALPVPLEETPVVEDVVRSLDAEVALAPVLDEDPASTGGDSPPHAPRSAASATAPMPLPCRTTMRSSVTIRVLHPLRPTYSVTLARDPRR